MLIQDPSGGVTAVSFAHLGNVSRKGVRLGKVTYGGAVPVAWAQRLNEDTRSSTVPPESSFSLQVPASAGIGRLSLHKPQEGKGHVCLGCGRGEVSPHV